MKYLLLTLLLSTQLFAYEKNKPITIYGYVSEKENNYSINAYHIDGKGVKDTPFQLLFDSDEINLTITRNRSPQRYKLKGIILEKKERASNIFKVSSKEIQTSKMKAKSYLNNYHSVKFLIKSPMIGQEEAKRRKTGINHLTNIKVKANNKLIYNVNITPCIERYPVMKFFYQDIKPLSLTLEYTDNHEMIRENATNIKYIKRISKRPQKIKLLPNTRTYTTQIKSIQKIFGNITLIEDGIQLTAPTLAENGGSIPINIRSNIKFKSIALFIKSQNPRYPSSNYFNCGEKDKFSLVSQWFSTPYSLVDLSIRVKMDIGNGEILVVLQAENGKFYTIKKELQISIGGEGA